MDDQTKEEYCIANNKVKRGLCPICDLSLKNKYYCLTHGFIKSDIGIIIDNENFDSRLLEIIVG